MSEPRRVQLVSNGSASFATASASTTQAVKPSEKPAAHSQKLADKIKKSYRFNLLIPESTKTSFPEFSYTELLSTAEEEEAAAAADAADPFAAQDRADQDRLERIARKFEQKYAPKSGKRKRRDRLEDLVDLGDGYDDSDSFVDNTEAYDEYLPCSVTTKYGGFYVNTGVLDLIPASEDSIDDLPVHKKHKLQNDISDDSEDSSVLTDASKKEADRLKKKKLMKSELISKKRKNILSDGERKEKIKKKKLKIKETVTSKDLKLIDELGKHGEGTKVSISSTALVKPAVADSSADASKKPGATDAPHLSSIDSIIDSVISQAKQSAEDDDDEIELSNRLKDVMQRIKRLAVSSDGGLIRQFSEEINTLLITVDAECRRLPPHVRTTVMLDLGVLFACGREGLIKRVKKLSLTRHDDKLKRPINELREAVQRIMPGLLDRHQMELAAVEKLRQDRQADVGMGVVQGRGGEDDSEDDENGGVSTPIDASSGQNLQNSVTKRINNPRKKFDWTPELRECLCRIVRIKMEHYEMARIRSQSAEEYLKGFLEAEIKPLWERGWIQTRTLVKESRTAHERWTGSGGNTLFSKQTKSTNSKTDESGSAGNHSSKADDIEQCISAEDKLSVGNQVVNSMGKADAAYSALAIDHQIKETNNHPIKKIENDSNKNLGRASVESAGEGVSMNVSRATSSTPPYVMSQNVAGLNSLSAGNSNSNNNRSAAVSIKNSDKNKSSANSLSVNACSSLKASDKPSKAMGTSNQSNVVNTGSLMKSSTSGVNSSVNSPSHVAVTVTPADQWPQFFSKADRSQMTPEEIILLTSDGKSSMTTSEAKRCTAPFSHPNSERGRSHGGAGEGCGVGRDQMKLSEGVSGPSGAGDVEMGSECDQLKASISAEMLRSQPSVEKSHDVTSSRQISNSSDPTQVSFSAKNLETNAQTNSMSQILRVAKVSRKRLSLNEPSQHFPSCSSKSSSAAEHQSSKASSATGGNPSGAGHYNSGSAGSARFTAATSFSNSNPVHHLAAQSSSAANISGPLPKSPVTSPITDAGLLTKGRYSSGPNNGAMQQLSQQLSGHQQGKQLQAGKQQGLQQVGLQQLGQQKSPNRSQRDIEDQVQRELAMAESTRLYELYKQQEAEKQLKQMQQKQQLQEQQLNQQQLQEQQLKQQQLQEQQLKLQQLQEQQLKQQQLQEQQLKQQQLQFQEQQLKQKQLQEQQLKQKQLQEQQQRQKQLQEQQLKQKQLQEQQQKQKQLQEQQQKQKQLQEQQLKQKQLQEQQQKQKQLQEQQLKQKQLQEQQIKQWQLIDQIQQQELKQNQSKQQQELKQQELLQKQQIAFQQQQLLQQQQYMKSRPQRQQTNSQQLQHKEPVSSVNRSGNTSTTAQASKSESHISGFSSTAANAGSINRLSAAQYSPNGYSQLDLPLSPLRGLGSQGSPRSADPSSLGAAGLSGWPSSVQSSAAMLASYIMSMSGSSVLPPVQNQPEVGLGSASSQVDLYASEHFARKSYSGSSTGTDSSANFRK